MKEAYVKMLAWYKGLPWYWKILGALVLVLVVVLWLMSLFVKPLDGGRDALREIDSAHRADVNSSLETLTKEEITLKKEIIRKKMALAKKVNQAAKIDSATMERRKKISEAASMEELDALQKAFGL